MLYFSFFFFFFSLTVIFHVWTYFYLSQWASLIWGVIFFTNTWKFSVSLIITTPHSHSFWLPELLIDLYIIFIIYILVSNTPFIFSHFPCVFWVNFSILSIKEFYFLFSPPIQFLILNTIFLFLEISFASFTNSHHL